MKTLFNLPTILLVSGIFCSLNHTLQAQTNHQTTAVQSALTTDEAAVQSALTANEELAKRWVIQQLYVKDSDPSRKPPVGLEERSFWFIGQNYGKSDNYISTPELAVRGILESFIFWAYDHPKNYSNLFCAIQIMFQYSQGISKYLERNPNDPEFQKGKFFDDHYNNAASWLIQEFLAGGTTINYGIENTSLALHAFATYIRYKDMFTPSAKEAMRKWGNEIDKRMIKAGGTANLQLTFYARRYLWAVTGLGDTTNKASDLGYLINLARGTAQSGGTGEHASDPYGAQNLIPFLILAHCEPDPTNRNLFLHAYLQALNTYSYTWLDEEESNPGGHLVAFSERTYHPAAWTNPNGIKSLLSHYFGTPETTRHGLSGRRLLGTNQVQPVLLKLENHALAAATYGLNLNEIVPLTDAQITKFGLSKSVKDTKKEFVQNINRLRSPAISEPVTGRMSINSSQWQYYIFKSYGMYSLRTVYTTRGGFHLAGQTRPPGIMWTGSSGQRSNFHIGIPTLPAHNFHDKTDGYLSKSGIQQWYQYGPTMLFVCDFNKNFKSENKPYIFGGMPGSASVVVDTQYASTRTTSGNYRLFYNIKKASSPTNSSVFIALTCNKPFQVGIRDPLAIPGHNESGERYDNSKSFFIGLGSTNPDTARAAVAIETAHPSEFPGSNDDARFQVFKMDVLNKTSFNWNVNTTRLEYKNLWGHKLSKAWQPKIKTSNPLLELRNNSHPEYVTLPNGTTIYATRKDWPNREHVIFKK